MPSLYSLNSQSHPFWDFVASLDDDASRNQPSNNAEDHQASARTTAEASRGKSSGKQPTVEDEVAAESSFQEKGKAPESAAQPAGEPQQLPFRGRGRRGGSDSTVRGHGHHGSRSGPCGRRCAGPGGFGEPHQHHPSREGCDGIGDFNPFGMHGPPFGGFGLFGPPHREPPPPGTPGPYPHHGPPHHPERRRGARGRPQNFNLAEFLTNLGSRIGVDLSGAAQGLGLDRSAGGNTSTSEGVDFEPKADIFDTRTDYLIHLSLPGAKKEDLGVDWDGENSTLRVGGVVHRPGVDEETLKLIAVDGRKREVGVFEKKIHLGTKRDPAKIDIAGITAKMTDGVLVVKVPKIEVQHTKREVPISGSASPSPVREEKHQQQQQSPATISHRVDDTPTPAPITEKGPEVAAAAANDTGVDAPRSETEKGDEMDYDDPAEQLPEYKEPGQPDALDSEEDEGDYVKIDVK